MLKQGLSCADVNGDVLMCGRMAALMLMCRMMAALMMKCELTAAQVFKCDLMGVVRGVGRPSTCKPIQWNQCSHKEATTPSSRKGRAASLGSGTRGKSHVLIGPSDHAPAKVCASIVFAVCSWR